MVTTRFRCNTADFSDEEGANNTGNGETMVNGSAENARVAELETEIQQRDSLIQMKTDELRRIALQNHDYEVEVLLMRSSHFYRSRV